MESQMPATKKYLKLFAAALLAVLALVASLVYFSPERKLVRYVETGFTQVAEEVNKNEVFQNYAQLDRETVDYVEEHRKLEEEAKKIEDQFSLGAGVLKVMLYDSLSELDRKKNTEGLKEIANEVKYPPIIRSLAINFLVGNYELDFIEKPNYPRDLLFIGENFGNLLTEAHDDVELAIRRLNERSYEIFPNPLSAYRIAKWYAGELYKNPDASPEQKKSLVDTMNRYVYEGDTLFDTIGKQNNILTPIQMIGLMYELKARINHLSGGEAEETRKLFERSIAALRTPPVTAHQIVYMERATMYYHSFLMRENMVSSEYIQNNFRTRYDYLTNEQEPRKRNVRYISRLIAARDSTRADYPFLDFNRADIENINKFDPEFGKIIANLDLRKYVQGYPIESSLFGTITPTSKP